MRAFWLCIFLTLTLIDGRAVAATPADGFYALADSGQIGTTLDGKTIHLGNPLKVSDANAVIDSLSNDNNDYIMHVAVKPGTALCVAGKCITFTNYDSAQNVSIQHLSNEDAETFSKFTGTSVRKKEDPKYKIQMNVLLDKQSYSMNEPILVKLEICNKDSRPLTFIRGGRYRGYRDNQFYFTAYGTAGQMPDTGNSENTGGLVFAETIMPDDCYTTQKVDLRAWFTIKKPGTYLVHAEYFMEMQPPLAKTINFFSSWNETAAAPFYLTVQ